MTKHSKECDAAEAAQAPAPARAWAAARKAARDACPKCKELRGEKK